MNRLTLCSCILMLAQGACTADQTRVFLMKNAGRHVMLLSFGSQDREIGGRAARLLYAHGIRAGMFCSITCDVFLRFEDLAEARRILLGDPELGPILRAREELERLGREGDDRFLLRDK